MVSNPISQPIPTFELVSHEATESSFCAIVGYLGSCSQVSMVSLKEGFKDSLKITTDLPSTVPEDFFSSSISGYSNIYNIPKFQIATTSSKFYIAMDGVITATGDLPSSVKLGSKLEINIVRGQGTNSYQVTLNAAYIGYFPMSEEIHFIFQGVSQGTMTVVNNLEPAVTWV
ncbi:hypothetical protein ACR3K2_38650 [Cryptosporidium serpentis]